MIRQYRRVAGDESADETERKLSKLQELERKTQRQEITITEAAQRGRGTTRIEANHKGKDTAAVGAWRRLRAFCAIERAR